MVYSAGKLIEIIYFIKAINHAHFLPRLRLVIYQLFSRSPNILRGLSRR